MCACVRSGGGGGGGGGDPPRSLLFIMALEPRRRGPCWVKWYPNFSRVVFFSSMLAISISTLFPNGWLWGEREGGGTRGGIEALRRTPAVKKKRRPRRWIPHTWLSIFSSCRVVLCCSDSIRARIPVPVMKLDSTFRLFRVVFTFSISARAWKSTELWQSLMTATAIFGICCHDDTEEWKTTLANSWVYRYNKWIWRAWRMKQTCTRDSRTQQGRCSWFLRCWTSPPLCSLSEPRRTTSGSWWGCSECGKQTKLKWNTAAQPDKLRCVSSLVSLATRAPWYCWGWPPPGRGRSSSISTGFLLHRWSWALRRGLVYTGCTGWHLQHVPIADVQVKRKTNIISNSAPPAVSQHHWIYLLNCCSWS